MPRITAEIEIRVKCLSCHNELYFIHVKDDREGCWLAVEQCDRCREAAIKESTREYVTP